MKAKLDFKVFLIVFMCIQLNAKELRGQIDSLLKCGIVLQEAKKLRENVDVLMHVQKTLWDQLVFTYGDTWFFVAQNGSIQITQGITEKTVIPIGRKWLFGHHGFYLDPKCNLCTSHRMLQSKDILVDMDNQQVTDNGNIVKLGPCDYLLLVYLMEHAGKLMSRERLLTFLESHQKNILQDNTLSVHIGRIRKGLGNSECIQTVNRCGYRWNWDVERR